MPPPDRSHLRLPYYSGFKEESRLEANWRALDRWGSDLPIFQKATFPSGTVCAGASATPGVYLDFDYASTNNANTRFQLSHRKYGGPSQTDILITCSLSCFGTVAATVFFPFILALSGVSLTVAGAGVTQTANHQFAFNNTSVHFPIVSIYKVSSLIAGVYNYKPVWSGIMSTDANDMCMYTVEEVPIYP